MKTKDRFDSFFDFRDITDFELQELLDLVETDTKFEMHSLKLEILSPKKDKSSEATTKP